MGYLDVSVDGVQLGPATYLPRVEPSETRYEFSDDATLVKSNHTLKFGFNFFTTEDYNYYISNAFGSYTYATPTTFAEDYSNAAGTIGLASGKNWTGYSQTFGNPIADYRINELAWYVNDQWKVNSKLTVNLGVRWDKSLSMNFPVTNPAWPDTGFIHTPSHNFSPRVGHGIPPQRQDGVPRRIRLVLCASDRWIDRQSLGHQRNLSDRRFALRQRPCATRRRSGVSHDPTFGAHGSFGPAATIQFAAPNLKTPYSAQGNITLERQITPDILLSVSGIFSRGIHLLSSVDVNANAPTSSFTYTINNTSGQSVGTFTTPIYTNPRPNPAFGAVIENTNGIDSVYDGLAVTLNKSFTHGLQMLGSYTWSHEIDDGQGQASNALFYSSITTLYNGNNAAERASGWEDQRHRFVYSFVWSPEVHMSNGIAKAILGNWQLSAIATLASGRPYTSPSISGTLSAMLGYRNHRVRATSRRTEPALLFVSRHLRRKPSRSVPSREQHPDTGVLPGRCPRDQEYPHQDRRSGYQTGPQLRDV